MEDESHAVSPISAGDQSTVSLRIAVPVADGKLSPHFGHCSIFALIDVKDNEIVRKELVLPPGHQPGLLPGWLHDKGANVVIAGGIGMRAKALLEQAGIRVIAGVAPEEPEAVVRSYLAGNLSGGENLCDH